MPFTFDFAAINLGFLTTTGVGFTIFSTTSATLASGDFFSGFTTGFTIATLFCAVVHTYPLLMAARIMAGAFGGLTGAIVFAIVGDLIPYERRGKATGIIMSAFSLASVIGVPIGLWLAELYNWNAPFFGLFGFSAVTLVFAHFYTPSVKGHLSSLAKHPLKTLETLFFNKNHLTAFALITMMMFGGFSVIPFIAPYLVANVGITNTELSYLYILGGGFTVFTARIIGSLADKFGKPLIFAIIAIISILPILALTNLPKVPLYITLTVTTCFFVFVSGLLFKNRIDSHRAFSRDLGNHFRPGTF